MFGEKLRNFRKEKGLSQRDLAGEVGIDFTYLSKIENGVLPPPADETIIRIARALSVEADELLLAAQRIPPDLEELVTRSNLVPQLVRTTKGLSDDELQKILRFAESFQRRDK